MCSASFALTVAGQWRIYTAFPYTLSGIFIPKRDESVNRSSFTAARLKNSFKHKLLLWSILWA